MMQNTVFKDARLWVFILLFSIFFVRLETVHNIEGASCELSISKTRPAKKWQAANERGSHSTRPAGVAHSKGGRWHSRTYLWYKQTLYDSPSLEQNLFPNNSLSPISLFINMTHMTTSIPKKVLGSGVEVQNESRLEECLPGVPGCRPCISLLI